MLSWFLSALLNPVYVPPVHLVIILLPSLRAVFHALLVCKETMYMYDIHVNYKL